MLGKVLLKFEQMFQVWRELSVMYLIELMYCMRPKYAFDIQFL